MLISKEMKKIYILLILWVFVAGLISCDMDKLPYHSVETSQYMTKASDFASARVGLYSPYRGMTTGAYLLMSEFQGDDFNAVTGFSNAYGNQYRWDFQPTDGNMESIWGNYYSHISRCNYFIDSYKKIEEAETSNITEAEMITIQAYVGEAYFTRAYDYFQLSCFFCKTYEPSTAENDWGLPLQLIYNPTPFNNTYPGRSSMKQTYEQILSDLTQAAQMVDVSKTVETNKTAINYISQDVVKAMQARVALQMKDYPTAIRLSTELINSGKYPLTSVGDDGLAFREMWVTDVSTENIWQIFMSKDELGSPTGSLFWGARKSNLEEQLMDYIPSQKLLNLYDAANDIRFSAFFAPFTLNTSTGASGDIYVFDKYPGNPALSSVVNIDNYYVNMSKPFRISEQYLIAAEAYAASNDLIQGEFYLNELRKNRIIDYTDVEFSSIEELMVNVQDERHKELVGEGFRITDLKRWGLAMERGDEPQDPTLVLFPGGSNTTALRKEAGDYRFVWPIPKAEMDVNPQLKGQQNSGY
jgi:hypothetical protein